MEARAYLKYARISPRKVSVVLDLIRNKPVDYAMAVLKHTPKAACEDLEKLLKSQSPMLRTTTIWTFPGYTWPSAMCPRARSSSAFVPERRVAHSASTRRPRTSPSCSRNKNNAVEEVN